MKKLFSHTRYIEIADQTYKVYVHYYEGVYRNYTLYGRGYYMTVYPCKVETISGVIMESFTAFSGAKKYLFEANRQSKKSEEKAIEMSKQFESQLIDQVLQGAKQGNC